MTNIKKRSEIDNIYKWDLTKIYKSDKVFLNEIKKIEKELPKLSKYKDTMLNSGNDLYDSLNHLFEVSRIIEKIYTYAHLKNDEDISLSSSIELMNKAETIYIKFSQTISYFSPKLLSIDYKQVEKFYKECPKLKEYQRYLEIEFRYQKYKLSEVEEKLISDLSKAFAENEDIFSSLTDSDIDFGTIKDENDKEVVLTNTNYSLYVKSNKLPIFTVLT